LFDFGDYIDLERLRKSTFGCPDIHLQFLSFECKHISGQDIGDGGIGDGGIGDKGIGDRSGAAER
ncbi:MAG: hypothetical protein ACOC36_06800, partial [Fibrobacterota bacterium]